MQKPSNEQARQQSANNYRAEMQRMSPEQRLRFVLEQTIAGVKEEISATNAAIKALEKDPVKWVKNSNINNMPIDISLEGDVLTQFVEIHKKMAYLGKYKKETDLQQLQLCLQLVAHSLQHAEKYYEWILGSILNEINCGIEGQIKEVKELYTFVSKLPECRLGNSEQREEMRSLIEAFKQHLGPAPGEWLIYENESFRKIVTELYRNRLKCLVTTLQVDLDLNLMPLGSQKQVGEVVASYQKYIVDFMPSVIGKVTSLIKNIVTSNTQPPKEKDKDADITENFAHLSLTK
jgi:hypothetical protein